jgi:hypothetical protein
MRIGTRNDGFSGLNRLTKGIENRALELAVFGSKGPSL